VIRPPIEFTADQRPSVLVLNENDWTVGTLETILQPAGYTVTRSYTQRDGIRRARTRKPDAVIVNAKLPDGDGPTVCRVLRGASEIGVTTPLIVSYGEKPSRLARRDALRAGAWHLIEPPIDPEFLLLYLDVFVQAKRQAERYRKAALLDQETGLYTWSAIEQRAEELVAWATRMHEPLACLVLAPGSAAALNAAVKALAGALRKNGRRSDTIGRASDTEFVVLAPATDAAGAMRMAERLSEGLEPGFGDELRAGYHVWDRGPDPVTGLELVTRARRALDRSGGSGASWVSAWGN